MVASNRDEISERDFLPPYRFNAVWEAPTSEAPRRVEPAAFVEGGVAAFAVAAMAVVATDAWPEMSWLTMWDLARGAALASAVVLSFLFVPAAISADRVTTIGVALLYGIATAMGGSLVLTAGIPIGLPFSIVAWPITVPAAAAWVVLIRARRRWGPRGWWAVLFYVAITCAATGLFIALAPKPGFGLDA